MLTGEAGLHASAAIPSESHTALQTGRGLGGSLPHSHMGAPTLRPGCAGPEPSAQEELAGQWMGGHWWALRGYRRAPLTPVKTRGAQDPFPPACVPSGYEARP